MAPRRIDVFFYGLFMDAELLRTKGAEPVNTRIAAVPGFELRIGQRATLLRNACAWGMLMQLTHAEIEQLYSEPSVQAYRPEAVLAQLRDGSFLPALCFNLVDPPAPEEKNPEYAAKLKQLAIRLRLPSGYIEGMR
jgi:hypothetical protein